MTQIEANAKGLEAYSSAMITLSEMTIKESFGKTLTNIISGIGNLFGSGENDPMANLKNFAGLNIDDDAIKKDVNSLIMLSTELEKGSEAIDNISTSLDKISDLKFSGNIKMKNFAKNLLESAPVIEKAIMGGTIDKFGPWNDVILKGLASQDIKWNEAAQNIDLLMQSLNPQTSINAQRTAQMQQASLQNSVNGMGGGQTVMTNAPITSVNTTNQSNTSVAHIPFQHPSPVVNIVNAAT